LYVDPEQTADGFPASSHVVVFGWLVIWHDAVAPGFTQAPVRQSFVKPLHSVVPPSTQTPEPLQVSVLCHTVPTQLLPPHAVPLAKEVVTQPVEPHEPDAQDAVKAHSCVPPSLHVPFSQKSRRFQTVLEQTSPPQLVPFAFGAELQPVAALQL
jgi:hypothetical protein